MKDKEKPTKTSKKGSIDNMTKVDLSHVSIKSLESHGLFGILLKSVFSDEVKLKLAKTLEYMSVTGCSFKTSCKYNEILPSTADRILKVPEIRRYVNNADNFTTSVTINDKENKLRLQLLNSALNSNSSDIARNTLAYKTFVDSNFGRARGFDITDTNEEAQNSGIQYLMPIEFIKDHQTQYEDFLKNVVLVSKTPKDTFVGFEDWLMSTMEQRDKELDEAMDWQNNED